MNENITREEMEVDVLIIGAGAAGLTTAYQLRKLFATQKKTAEPPTIMLIDKASSVGAHSLSGAVLDPASLLKVIPDYQQQNMPLEMPVEEEAIYYFKKNGQIKLPFIPPGFNNHGLPIISLSKFNNWLAELLETKGGVDILPGFAAKEILFEDKKIAGVRTDDKGIDAKGQKKANFEPGIDLKAKVTVFADGVRGFLSKQLFWQKPLTGKQNPQLFETGVKEIWRLKEGTFKKGTVLHSFGYPLGNDTSGGSFIYTMKDNLLVVGFVVSLDYHDPEIEPYHCLQQFKQHPFVSKLLAGGELLHYGAKALSAGGYYSLPQLAYDGGLIVGEAAGLLNAQRLKGIHLAIESGRLAAETIFASLNKNDCSQSSLEQYQDNVINGEIGKELYKVRNFHQALAKGMPWALPHLATQTISGGRGLVDPIKAKEDRQYYRPLKEKSVAKKSYDGKLTISKTDNVYNSGTKHDEDQPSHLLIEDHNICIEKCLNKYNGPCQRFCPAEVYEIVENSEKGGKRLQVNFTNCVHCQTCDIKCPFDNIRWTPPEGGQGPNYGNM